MKDNLAHTENHFISLKSCKQVIPDSSPVYCLRKSLDNTIYPKSSGIDELMAQRIEMFFINYSRTD